MPGLVPGSCVTASIERGGLDWLEGRKAQPSSPSSLGLMERDTVLMFKAHGSSSAHPASPAESVWRCLSSRDKASLCLSVEVLVQESCRGAV